MQLQSSQGRKCKQHVCHSGQMAPHMVPTPASLGSAPHAVRVPDQLAWPPDEVWGGRNWSMCCIQPTNWPLTMGTLCAPCGLDLDHRLDVWHSNPGSKPLYIARKDLLQYFIKPKIILLPWKNKNKILKISGLNLKAEIFLLAELSQTYHSVHYRMLWQQERGLKPCFSCSMCFSNTIQLTKLTQLKLKSDGCLIICLSIRQQTTWISLTLLSNMIISDGII